MANEQGLSISDIIGLGDLSSTVFTRDIFIFEEIEETLAERVVKTIHHLNFLDPNRLIKIHICSIGGSVHEAFAIYDAMLTSPSKIAVLGYGAICSAATVLLAAGEQRYASPLSWAMCHKPSFYAEGTPLETKAQVEISLKLEKMLHQILGKHTNKPAKFWAEKIKEDEEIWMDAKEMKKLGIIDKVLTKQDVKSLLKQKSSKCQ